MRFEDIFEAVNTVFPSNKAKLKAMFCFGAMAAFEGKPNEDKIVSAKVTVLASLGFDAVAIEASMIGGDPKREIPFNANDLEMLLKFEAGRRKNDCNVVCKFVGGTKDGQVIPMELSRINEGDIWLIGSDGWGQGEAYQVVSIGLLNYGRREIKMKNIPFGKVQLPLEAPSAQQPGETGL